MCLTTKHCLSTAVTVAAADMNDARLPVVMRDMCAHLAIPLNACRVNTKYAPWACGDEHHAYEKCEFKSYVRRLKIHADAKGQGRQDH